MAWYDIYKLSKYVFEPDGTEKKSQKTSRSGSAGYTQSSLAGLRNGTSGWGVQQAPVGLRIGQGSEYVDITSTAGRNARLKEYDRLQTVAEIETALNTLADECCVAGNTQIITLFGAISIEELARSKKPDETFLVYCWNFETEDYTLGWAYHPRLVKEAETVKVIFENGKTMICTPDHRLLLKSGEWREAGELKEGDELIPFYRVKPNADLSPYKTNQFPRIFTFNKGWIHERQFIDEWKLGKDLPQYEMTTAVSRCVHEGMSIAQMEAAINKHWSVIQPKLDKNGINKKELEWLDSRYIDRRRVLGVTKHGIIPVYDLSVRGHENFATDCVIAHNCQEDDEGHIFKVHCEDPFIKKEAETLLRKVIEIDDKAWSIQRNLCKAGDHFIEVILDTENPIKYGITKIASLPVETMHRIETTKGRLLEFQQNTEAPDLTVIDKPMPVKRKSETEEFPIRFTPEQIIHMRLGDDRKDYYPYGVSLIDAARGPALQLKLMEDAMLVYRLCLVGDTRIRTNCGYKLLKDLQVGDNIWSYYDYNLIPSKVISFVNNGIKDIIKVRSKHVELRGTGTHPVLVNRNGNIQYVNMQNLKIGVDRLLLTTHESNEQTPIPFFHTEPWAKLSPEQLKSFRNNKYKNKSDLLRTCHDFGRAKQFLYNSGKALPLDKAEKICNVFGLDSSKLILVNKTEKISLPKFVNEEFARLFGFLCGKGNIGVDNIKFTADENEVTNYYWTLLLKYFNKVSFSNGSYFVHSKTACETFLQMDYKKDNFIPKWVYNSPKNIRRSFVEGLSSAIGSERFANSGTWFSTIKSNETMIQDIKELWSSIGLCSGHIKTQYNEETMLLTYSLTISDCLLPNEEFITSVKEDGKEEVYDITVDNEHHNFIANSSPVHNSRAPERRVFYIDVGNIPQFRAEAYMERTKDQFRKKKVFNKSVGGFGIGASGVEEKWHAPAQDEDYWIPVRQGSGTRIETLPGACLALDTEIPLLDGRKLKLSEIIAEFESGKQLWAYSCNPKTGAFSPGKITWAGVTRRNAQVIKVTLDNGKSVVCTPDHKFPVQGRDGKIEAQSLNVGDSLIPWNVRTKQINKKTNEYTQLYCNESRKWEFVHRLVVEGLNNTKYIKPFVFKEEHKDAKKTTIHHFDINRFNNNPENLVLMNWYDHLLLHSDYMKNLSYEDRLLMNDKISSSLKEYHDNLSDSDKKARNETLKLMSLNGSKITLNKLKNDEEFRASFVQKQIEGFEKSKIENPEYWEEKSKSMTKRNEKFWSNPENKKIVFEKQTINYPKDIFDKLCSLLSNDMLLEDALNEINATPELMQSFVSSNRHIKRNVDFSKGLDARHAKKLVQAFGFSGIRELRRSLLGGILKSKSGSEGKLYGKYTIIYPKAIFSKFLTLLQDHKNADDVLEIINSNEELMTIFKEANKHVKRKGIDLNQGIKRTHILRMVQSFGYESLEHARKETNLYNHKVAKIEWLTERIDTGTLTIDGQEEINDYHTFALSDCGVYTYNSNLGEVDDCLYFRNKLFVSLNFPKNYLSNDDPQATRLTLSQQDVRFARFIERLQKPLQKAVKEIVLRHLRIKGFPEEVYEDLDIEMTQPSDWRKINRNEVTQASFDRAATLKGSQMMSDFDIYVKIMGYTEDEAKQVVSRMKAQKLEDLRLQIIASNPQYLGLNTPANEGQELGTKPGGPSPELGTPPEGATPPEGTPPPEDGQSPQDQQQVQQKQSMKLPNVDRDAIVKYDLEISGYEGSQDEEEVDVNDVE